MAMLGTYASAVPTGNVRIEFSHAEYFVPPRGPAW
jgi:hypothetical protein